MPITTTIQKALPVEIKAIDADNSRVVAVVSTGKRDRDGEVILPDAWQLDYFKRAGVFLWAHAHRSQDPQNVLGRVVGIEKTPAGLLATFEYDTDINPKAKLVFDQVKKGTLKAFSVGFLPTKWVTANSPKIHVEALPEEARKALEGGDVFVVYTEAELLEISQVPIPSNPDALVGASVKSVRLRELKQIEEETTMDKIAEKVAPDVIAAEKAPDIEAIVKAAVHAAQQPLVDQVAALTEQVAKLAAPAQEKAAEEPAIEEARNVLRAMSDEQLKAFFANATDEMRADALALFAE